METFESFFNALASPEIYTILVTMVFGLYCWKYRTLTKTPWAIGLFAVTTLFFVIGSQNADFYKIITKGDNMPIVIMIYSLYDETLLL